MKHEIKCWGCKQLIPPGTLYNSLEMFRLKAANELDLTNELLQQAHRHGATWQVAICSLCEPRVGVLPVRG